MRDTYGRDGFVLGGCSWGNERWRCRSCGIGWVLDCPREATETFTMNRELDSGEEQLRVQSELKACECLIWSGVADARHTAIAAIPETITPGIAFVGFALLWMVQAYGAASSALTIRKR